MKLFTSIFILSLFYTATSFALPAYNVRAAGDFKVEGTLYLKDGTPMVSSDGLLKNRGDFVPATEYFAGDVVQFAGNSFVCILANTAVPPFVTTNWSPLALQGLTGAQGIQGIQGATGQQGLKGDTGSQGLQGTQGLQGIQGVKGDKGDNSTVSLMTICNAIGMLNAILPSFCDAVGITSIVVTPATSSIVYGTTQQFSATATYADGSTAPLTTGVAWSSQDICSLSGLNAYVTVAYASVLLGDTSPLSPSAKVIEARTQFNTLYALARVGNVDAISKIQSLSNIFLTISRAYYASSSPYFTDFNTVTASLADTTSIEIRDMTAANANACGLGSLRAFKNSLMISTLGGLSPYSKWTTARAQFDDIFLRAKLGDTEANWQFNTVANAFLSASSAYNASGPAYVADFNTVSQAQTQIQALILPASPASIASGSGLASGASIGRSKITATSKGKSGTSTLTITIQ